MVALNWKHRANRKKRRKHRKATKISYPREQEEEGDWDEPALNKILTTSN